MYIYQHYICIAEYRNQDTALILVIIIIIVIILIIILSDEV